MLFFLSFKNLFRNIRRTVAILLTVALGVGALFAFEGFIHGVLTDYQESTIHALAGNGQIHKKGYLETVYKEPWNHWISNLPNLKTFLKNTPFVQYIFPRISVSGMLMNKKVSIVGQGQGIDAKEEAKFFHSLNIIEGKNLSSEEKGILLGKGLATALGVHPGDEITFYTKSIKGKISKAKFIVTGIFHTGNVDFDGHVFRIQLRQAQELLNTSLVESISLGLFSQKHWEMLSSMIKKAFPNLDSSSFAELDKVYYQNSVDWLKTQFHVVQIIIISIVLLGIFNTISSSILERKQEMGNLRANGESIQDVLRLILSEGSLLGIFGSVIGLFLSYLIAKGFLHEHILMPPGPGSNKQFYLSFSFTLPMAMKSFFLGTFSAIIASFVAGYKVVKMPIAKALRAY